MHVLLIPSEFCSQLALELRLESAWNPKSSPIIHQSFRQEILIAEIAKPGIFPVAHIDA